MRSHPKPGKPRQHSREAELAQLTQAGAALKAKLCACRATLAAAQHELSALRLADAAGLDVPAAAVIAAVTAAGLPPPLLSEDIV